MESESIHHLLHLAHHYLLPSENYPPKPSSSSGSSHFFQSILAKLKKRLWPSSSHSNLITVQNPIQRLTIKPIPSAKRLQDAGIKLKRKEAQGFSNISFNKNRGVLEILYLHINSNTEILLRNLVAWEQCHPETLQYFTGYAILMDYIVNSAEDVEILLKGGIIEQSLGSYEEVASIFNGLSTNLVYEGDDGGHLPALCCHIQKNIVGMIITFGGQNL